jgi:hypothetical protein
MQSVVNMEVMQHCCVFYSQVCVARHRPLVNMLSGTGLSAVPDMVFGGKVIADHKILLQHYAGWFFNVSTAECTETEILNTDEAITSKIFVTYQQHLTLSNQFILPTFTP